MREEPRKEEKRAEPHKDVKERKRRFQIVKLEERIAPGGGHGHGHTHNAGRTCGTACIIP